MRGNKGAIYLWRSGSPDGVPLVACQAKSPLPPTWIPCRLTLPQTSEHIHIANDIPSHSGVPAVPPLPFPRFPIEGVSTQNHTSGEGWISGGGECGEGVVLRTGGKEKRAQGCRPGGWEAIWAATHSRGLAFVGRRSEKATGGLDVARRVLSRASLDPQMPLRGSEDASSNKEAESSARCE